MIKIEAATRLSAAGARKKGDRVKFKDISGEWTTGVLMSDLTTDDYGEKGYYITEDGDNFKPRKDRPGRYFVYPKYVKSI